MDGTQIRTLIFPLRFVDYVTEANIKFFLIEQ